jgi:cysteinyl-tRNA synthetase
VYDHSHMGHARTYLGFDIVLRILRDYFRYDIKYVMNVTDVDDKIIRKANLNLLSSSIDQIRDSDFKKKVCLELINDAKHADKQIPLVKIREYLGAINISTTPDFSTVTRLYEGEFRKEMHKLQIVPPVAVTRVTEYIPEIISYIQKIVDQGHAYLSNGSVYFNTKGFSHDHTYCKLEPWSQTQVEKGLEGEGEWSRSKKLVDKKNVSDFVLWKKSNDGEPSWDSPFGQGRPGWHIECSVMASQMLGSNIDIHCGGIDLRFPHHDNELAQSESYHNCQQWVNYFLHTGHLTIEGRSMSKSKKNFVTISEALQKYTPRQLRFLFVLHNFYDSMEYSETTMNTAIYTEKLFVEFVKNVVVATKTITDSEKWTSVDNEMYEFLLETKKRNDDFLRDSFDTQNVMKCLQVLITRTNSSMNTLKIPLLLQISDYVQSMLNVFGILLEDGGSSKDVGPMMDSVTNFRHNVRKIARESKQIEILKECDKFRDELLGHGIRIEDRKDGSIWKKDF